MATQVIKQIYECIEINESFLLDAGAGSGKTHALMQTIEYLQCMYSNKCDKKTNILCITFTNVAKNEILDRLSNKANITVATMHDFLWGFIKQYQLELIKEVRRLIDSELDKLDQEVEKARRILAKPRKNTNIQKKQEELQKAEKLIDRYNDSKFKTVDYKNYRAINKGIISHKDILKIATEFLKKDDFCNLFFGSYSHIFIDEYQDSNEELVVQMLQSLKKYKQDSYLVMGLFGDQMQQIYSKDATGIFYSDYGFSIIPKLDNFRSCKEIVFANNALRGDGLNQVPRRNDLVLDKIEFIFNANKDTYLKGYEKININEYKRLFLSHREIAEEVGFSSISYVFNEQYGRYANEKLLKKEDALICFILDKLIRGVYYFKQNDFSLMLEKLKSSILTQDNLGVIKKNIESLIDKNPQLSEVASELLNLDVFSEKEYSEIRKNYVNNNKLDFLKNLEKIHLSEYLNLFRQVNGDTNLQTLHGVKGEEYEKVIVNIREKQKWSSYNFDNLFMESDSESASYKNAHKLFYVACTRAKKSLLINYVVTANKSCEFEKVKDGIMNHFNNQIEFVEYKSE